MKILSQEALYAAFLTIFLGAFLNSSLAGEEDEDVQASEIVINNSDTSLNMSDLAEPATSEANNLRHWLDSGGELELAISSQLSDSLTQQPIQKEDECNREDAEESCEPDDTGGGNIPSEPPVINPCARASCGPGIGLEGGVYLPNSITEFEFDSAESMSQ